MRAELHWQGKPGAAGAITSALGSWNLMRFELTEDASPGCDAVRYSYTPALGTFSAVVAANGDIVVPENRLRAAMALADAAKSGDSRGRQSSGPTRAAAPCPRRLSGGRARLLLGEPWDAELEPFRRAGDGAPVRWLNATG